MNFWLLSPSTWNKYPSQQKWTSQSLASWTPWPSPIFTSAPHTLDCTIILNQSTLEIWHLHFLPSDHEPLFIQSLILLPLELFCNLLGSTLYFLNVHRLPLAFNHYKSAVSHVRHHFANFCNSFTPLYFSCIKYAQKNTQITEVSPNKHNLIISIPLMFP